jgi:NADH-quinone oxidoreductase subunit G
MSQAVAQQPALVPVFIDGQEFQLPERMNLVDALKLIGKEVPHYCYHPKLPVAGNCRMCLVEAGSPMIDRATNQPVLEADGKTPKIGWQPKPAIACATTVSRNLYVKLDSPAVKACREGVTEMLLVNHPLDCPICDQAGECKLQEYSADYGKGYSRYVEDKNVKPKKTKLGPRVTLDDERCILCSRCVRFQADIMKDPVLGFINRGSYNTLTCYPGRELDNNYSLNTVDICPVGALTQTDFRFKMRVWFLKETPSIDTESSTGANTVVWSREGVIHRITPRRNDAVNDTWMADSGRELFKTVTADNRIRESRTAGAKVSYADAVAKAVELLKSGSVAYVASGHLSVEEQHLLAQLVKAAPGTVHLPAHTGKADGLLISEDRTPNTRGALAAGLVCSAPTATLAALAADIDAGKVKVVFTAREDLVVAGLTAAQLAKVQVIALATHDDATTRAAAVVIPGLTVFEKSGSFINVQWRLQKFAQVIPGPAGVVSEVQTLNRLVATVKGETVAAVDNELVWKQLAAARPVFAGVTGFAALPCEGLALDGAAFADVKLAEQSKLLKYAPAAPVVANA